MQQETIWIACPERLENQHGFTFAPGATKAEREPFREDQQRASAAAMKTLRGLRLEPHEVPARLIHFAPGRVPFAGPVPPVIANAGVFLRDDVKAVFDPFDLGAAQVFPVQLCDTTPDREIPVPVWYLNPVNSRRTVDPGLSGMERPKLGTLVGDYYHPPSDLRARHRLVRTHREAMGGPDLWIDPMIHRTLFLSQRLAERLVAEGLQKAFDLWPTTLVT
jgi:hypothetical protein